MKPVVSIIVPVYGAEKTLSRCVDSILGQTYQELELILVDDGSKDSSPQICDAYARKDDRVRVIHQKNAGVSMARNAALSVARGAYVQFADSDDWVTPDATRALVDAATEHGCDLVVADFYRVIGDRVSQKGNIEEGRLLTCQEYAAYMLDSPADFYYGVLWNKLYRRELIEQHSLRMDTSVNWCEDTIFNLQYLHHVKTVYPLQVPIYYYVKTKNSLANQAISIPKVVRMKTTLFAYYHDFFKELMDEETFEKNRLKIYRFFIDAAGDGAVMPLLPGGKKLGEERLQISETLLSGESMLHDAFRERKLLERFLETAALQHNLTLPEAKLMISMSEAPERATKKELADFANLSRSSFTLLTQKLTAKGLLKVMEEQKLLSISYSETGEKALLSLQKALLDCQQAVFRKMTEEEITTYLALREKLQDTIKELL